MYSTVCTIDSVKVYVGTEGSSMLNKLRCLFFSYVDICISIIVIVYF